MSLPLRFFSHGLRLAIGGLFVYSGVAKIIDPLGTTDSVRNYALLADPWITVVALLLPWVEIIAGALLLVARCLPGALAVVAASAVVFVAAIGSAWWRGLDISCGCLGSGGGGSGPVHYAWHLAGLTALLIACGWLWLKLPVNSEGRVRPPD